MFCSFFALIKLYDQASKCAAMSSVIKRNIMDKIKT